MNPRDLLDMAGDPRFIPGIYNYCDRWCERCAYTGRCLNFAHGEIMAAELEEDDESDALAEQLSESLQDAVDLIELIAEEEGIELDLESPEVEEMMVQEEQARERAANHPLTGAADPYIGMVNDWFGVGKPEYTVDLPPLEGDGARAGDAAEVIRWFQFFISVKIRRALGSRESEAHHPVVLGRHASRLRRHCQNCPDRHRPLNWRVGHPAPYLPGTYICDAGTAGAVISPASRVGTRIPQRLVLRAPRLRRCRGLLN